MRFLLPIALVAWSATASFTEAQIEVDLVGTAANHQLSWTTSLNRNYQVFASIDAENWIDTGIAEPGTGSAITYGMMSTADTFLYRVHETVDPHNGGFLTLPTHLQEVDLIDGVCFAFNLNIFSTLPEKIRLYERDYNSGDQWEQIGALTDFDEIDNIKLVRGSAVWLPDAEGDYEVFAAVVDGVGAVSASAVRRVIVSSNQPPIVTIVSGPPTPSAFAEPAVFTARVQDPDGDPVNRVEFYDNGILIGTDTTPTPTANPNVFEFGDDIEDLEGNGFYDLLRGIHGITAKAYDSQGSVGETASASQFVVTGGNARPVIVVTSPASGLIVTQGQSFSIAYDVSDPDGASDINRVESLSLRAFDGDSDSASPFENLTLDTTGWQLGTHTIRVTARDTSGDRSYRFYFSVFIRTGSGPTFAETLVANIVDESTAAPSNESFAGTPDSSGEFSTGFDSGLEIGSGVALTTGLFSTWNGGDEGDDIGTVVDTAGDRDLEDRIAGTSTVDAAVLEFDVFCANGQLEMEFQFGSEEYEEFVFDTAQFGCFNDAFMVTVDGTVVSLVPDCSDIVAVNSIHPLVPADISCTDIEIPAVNDHLFLDEDIDIFPGLTPSNVPVQLEYDGVTVRLRAHVFVTANASHSIKIVIADVEDPILDSALFIKEGSISTHAPQP